jgi:hypothetical protein
MVDDRRVVASKTAVSDLSPRRSSEPARTLATFETGSERALISPLTPVRPRPEAPGRAG